MLTRVYKFIKQREGFSLIEILVAIAIAATMMISLGTAQKVIMNAIREMTARSQFYDEINLAIEKIDRDIRCMYYNRENKKIVLLAEESQNNSVINFVTVYDEPLKILGDTKTSIHTSNIRETSYFLEADPQAPGHFLLMKREDSHYDDEPEEGGSSSMLLKNVLSLKFEFKKGNSWERRWDSKRTGNFPVAIRTTIKLHDYNVNEKSFSFISNIQLLQKNL